MMTVTCLLCNTPCKPVLVEGTAHWRCTTCGINHRVLPDTFEVWVYQWQHTPDTTHSTLAEFVQANAKFGSLSQQFMNLCHNPRHAHLWPRDDHACAEAIRAAIAAYEEYLASKAG